MSTEHTVTRKRSRLALQGIVAMRALLLETLEACDWHLRNAADALEMDSSAAVIRSIRHLGLDAEYQTARSAGRVRSGPRPMTANAA